MVPLIVLPYLTRVLGVSSYGIFGVVFAVSQYLILFTDFGFNLTSTKRIVEAQGNNEKISKIFFETIYCKLTLSILSLLFIVIYGFFTQDDKLYLALLVSWIQVLGTVLLPVWYFQGIEKMSFLTIAIISSKIILLPFFFFFVKSSEDLNFAIFFQSISMLVAGLISLALIIKNGKIKFVPVNIKEIINTYIDSYQIYIASLAISLYTVSNPIIINIFSTHEEVGLYAGADRIKAAILGLVLVLSSVLYPRVNALFAESRKKGFAFVRKILILQGGTTILLSVLVFVFSRFLVEIILGKQYIDAILILKILSPLIALIGFSVIIGNYILLPLGYKKEYVVLPILTAIGHIIAASILTMYFGAVGAAISIVGVEVITIIVFVFILYQKNLLKELW
ncbi:oligosaccharide flippase family protein [Photobacterium kishitanii]|uniref:oligosaccharide flippase family protein n=1 Tax=Photobacterium kishitanii TaxID=318456 RepID=UPI002738A11B|nr:oligosaccharide flippase family protein [Photobacterium kishitanii]